MHRQLALYSIFALFACAYATLDRVPRAALQTLRGGAYHVELWEAADRVSVERVLARASGIALARAIFTAALSERPDRRITVRRSRRILADSAG